MSKRSSIYLAIFVIVGVAVLFLDVNSPRFGLSRTKPVAVKLPDRSITLLEGWSDWDIGNYLEHNGVVKYSEFQQSVEDFDPSAYEFMASKPDSADLQGFIFPDTYFIPQKAASGTSLSEVIIKKALDNFGKKLPANYNSLSKNNGLTFYQTVVLASILEKETGRNAVTAEQKKSLDEERRIIAGIFYNRLNIGMALQSDATVNYVTGKNNPTPSEADTKEDSLYNTYKYRGLPPEPICNPSLSSIEAALNPTETSYFYFLHDQKTGQAIYAKTYEEHLANKQKYLK